MASLLGSKWISYIMKSSQLLQQNVILFGELHELRHYRDI